MRSSQLGVALVVLLAPGILLTPVWRLAGLGAGEDDVLYYLPARVFFHDTIRDGHWPWLDPWTGMGRPFAADPQNAVWYPATWLFAVLPPLVAYPLSLWLHYSLALWGMYRLLRALHLGRCAALFGGLVFAFGGFMLAHRAHFAMQHAAAWTPWVFWRLDRYARGAVPGARGSEGSTRRLGWAALVLAFQAFAGHTQIVALTALGALAFLLGRHREADTVRAPDRPATAIFRWLLASLCAVGLFAVQWLVTADYLRLCTRVERGYLDFVENSFSPASLIGWLLPMLFGQRTPNFFPQAYWGPSHQVEQFGYVGILPLVLAVAGLRVGWRQDAQRRPWVVMGVLALLLALGLYGPVCPLLYWIPGSSLFRCPARGLLLVNLALAALAAITIQDLEARFTPARVRLRATLQRWTRQPLALAVLLVAAPLLLVLIAVPVMWGAPRPAAVQALRPWNPAIWVPLVLAVGSLFVLRQVVRAWRRPAWLWLLTIVTAVDLAVVGWTIDVPSGVGSPLELVVPEGSATWVHQVRQTPHRLWVIAPRVNGTPGQYVRSVDKCVANTNVLAGVASLTHYGPLQPRAYAQRFGFEPWGECLKLVELLEDSRWMAAVDVGWVIICDEELPAPAGGVLEQVTSAGWRLYRQPAARGIAHMEDAARRAALRVESREPNSLAVRVDTWLDPRPGGEVPEAEWPRLVIAQLPLPGWRARVNAQPAAVEIVDELRMGVRVPPGEAVRVELRYEPPGLPSGAVITGLSAVCVAVALLWGRQ